MNRNAYLAPVLGLAILFAGGCASRPSSDRVVLPPTPGAASQPPKVQHELENPAVLALWREAEAARAGGEIDVAANAIERALRIAPGDPVLWSRLAELRLQAGQAVQAENLASKSNALAAENPTLRYRNWLIIGAARKQREDLPGARDAQVQSEMLRRALSRQQ